MGKVKLFTHTDLDGVGCEILAKLIYGEVDVDRLNYNNANETIVDFAENGNLNEYDKIFITDLNLKGSTLAALAFAYGDKGELYLFDHHVQSLEFNTIEWVTAATSVHSNNIRFSERVHETCGTELFWEFHLKNMVSKESEESRKLFDLLEEFVYLVTMRDTGHFDVKDSDSLNKMLHLYGHRDFVSLIIARLLLCHPLIDDTDKAVIDVENRKVDMYVNNAEKRLKSIQVLDYNVGVVSCETYPSEVGMRLNERHPDYDFIMIINTSNLTTNNVVFNLRTIHEHINLAHIAAMYGGGGHPKAAGFTLDIDFDSFINKSLFDNLVRGDELVKEEQR